MHTQQEREGEGEGVLGVGFRVGTMHTQCIVQTVQSLHGEMTSVIVLSTLTSLVPRLLFASLGMRG